MGRAGFLASFPLVFALAGCITGFDLGSWTGWQSERTALVKSGITARIGADELSGKWGLAAYHDNKDAERTEKAARNACGQPYLIGRGRGNTVLMHAPFSATASEMTIKSSLGSTYIGPTGEMSGGGSKDREVIRWDGKVLVTRYVDQHAYSIYGNMVFVRCGARA